MAERAGAVVTVDRAAHWLRGARGAGLRFDVAIVDCFVGGTVCPEVTEPPFLTDALRVLRHGAGPGVLAYNYCTHPTYCPHNPPVSGLARSLVEHGFALAFVVQDPAGTGSAVVFALAEHTAGAASDYPSMLRAVRSFAAQHPSMELLATFAEVAPAAVSWYRPAAAPAGGGGGGTSAADVVVRRAVHRHRAPHQH